MPTGALVAIGAADFEADVISAAAGNGLVVIRRCVDVADLLASAATRQARVALVSTTLIGIDAEVIARLAAERVTVVGVAAADPSPEALTLRRLGVDVVVPVARLDFLADAVGEAMEAAPAEPLAQASPWGSGGEENAPEPALSLDPTGRVVAVWGATGAPGRSTVALNLAAFAAASGRSTTLIDADVYGGAQAQLLGLLDESSGLLAAARSANRGALDPAQLASHARAIGERTRVLTGLPRSDRWVELSPVLLRRIIDNARCLSALTVVDCAFCVEFDEEISYDTTAPRRNGATLAALECADRIVVVGSADPVGLGRLLRALSELTVLVPDARPYVVVNRMRGSLGWSADEVADVIRRSAQIEVGCFLPDDPQACDRAMVQGRSLAEVASGSRLGKSFQRLAQEISYELPVG